MGSDGWFRCLVFYLVIAGGVVCAQVSSGVPQPNTLVDDKAIKVDTSLVDITVSVLGKDSKFVPNLSVEDFVVFEDGVEQKIEYFASHEQPFTVILLLDLSGSMKLNVDEIKTACLSFLDQLKPNDRIAAIVFNEEIRVLNTNFRDRETLKSEIRALSVAEKGTFLYPAVEAVSERILKKISGRKALVLFTDGIDGTNRGITTSRSAYKSSIQEAVRALAPVFSIKFEPDIRLTNGTRIVDDVADAYLNDLASMTGGRVFRDGISGSFKAVTDELRRQYSIGYYPQTLAKKNEVRKIEIRVKNPSLVVQSRKAYIGR